MPVLRERKPTTVVTEKKKKASHKIKASEPSEEFRLILNETNEDETNEEVESKKARLGEGDYHSDSEHVDDADENCAK